MSVSSAKPINTGWAPFRLLKFRTMHVGAELSLEDLLDELPEPMFKFRRDPRVTRVGRVLRRLSLDELPVPRLVDLRRVFGGQ